MDQKNPNVSLSAVSSDEIMENNSSSISPSLPSYEITHNEDLQINLTNNSHHTEEDVDEKIIDQVLKSSYHKVFR